MIFFDFKSLSPLIHSFSTLSGKGMSHVFRANHFFSTIRFSTQIRIQQMRRSLSGKPAREKLFLPKSVSLHGLCTTHRARKFARHRNLPSSHGDKIIPRRLSRQDFPKHLGGRQRKKRLANLSRLRPRFNRHRTASILSRGFRRGCRSDGLRARFNHDRSLPYPFSMGEISQKKSRRQNAHSNGLTRLHPLFYLRHRWKDARRQHYGRNPFGAKRFLRYGSSLHGFQEIIPSKPKHVIFRHSIQTKTPLSTPLVTPGREINRITMRSNHHSYGTENISRLSRLFASHPFYRPGYREEARVSYKQFSPSPSDDYSALQMPLADRTFFQMDQTAPSHQIVFWNVTKRREDANLDCHHCLRPRIHYEKETKNQSQSYGNPTNFEHCSFRENPYKTSLGERSLEN